LWILPKPLFTIVDRVEVQLFVCLYENSVSASGGILSKMEGAIDIDRGFLEEMEVLIYAHLLLGLVVIV
jgi:hypothetical protein